MALRSPLFCLLTILLCACGGSAAYTEMAPTSPAAWTAWTFWQHSQTGEVSGVVGEVDRDRYQGTAAGFQQLLVAAAPAP